MKKNNLTLLEVMNDCNENYRQTQKIMRQKIEQHNQQQKLVRYILPSVCIFCAIAFGMFLGTAF